MNDNMPSLRQSALVAFAAGALALSPIESKAWWSWDDADHDCGCGCGATWHYVLHYPQPGDEDENGNMPDAYSDVSGCEDVTAGCQAS